MKTTFIRLFAVMTLATSISAFALPKDAKDTTNSTVATTCAASTDAATKQDKAQSGNDQEKSRQMQIKEQEKQWLHDLDYPTAG